MMTETRRSARDAALTLACMLALLMIVNVLVARPAEAKTFTIQFFSNPAGGEGKKFVGQKGVTTNANGNVTFEFQPAQAVPTGQTVTATATDPNGNTSEFSAPEPAT